MKQLYNQGINVFLFVVLLTFGFSVPKVYAQYENTYVSYNDFYENLAPYGQWIDDPKYGYVWSPTADESFRPYYTNGHWAMTDYGNTWVSDYPWGWACFHYGRWTYDNYYGWLWIPGSDWGPAWVSWRYGDGYYGWAPLGPGYDFSPSAGDYSCPNDWWVFIPPQYLYTGNYYHYWYGPHGNSEIIGNTTFENNTYENNHITYVSGPRTKEIEGVTHQTVQVFHLRNSASNLNTRIHNNEIKMFRPAEIRPAAPSGGQRVSPPDVVAAPQAVRSPQAMNSGQATPPQFRNDMPQNNGRTETPGTNISQTAEPSKPAPRYDNNPYEWDVNKPIPQPRQNQENAPRQETNYRPQQQEQPRPQQPRPQPPVQQQPRQAPAQQPRPAPAPAQPRESGRR